MPVRFVRDVRYQREKYRLVVLNYGTRDNNTSTLLRDSGHVGHAGHPSTTSLVSKETHPVVTNHGVGLVVARPRIMPVMR